MSIKSPSKQESSPKDKDASQQENDQFINSEELSKMKQVGTIAKSTSTQIVKAERQKTVTEAFALRVLHSKLEGDNLNFIRESQIMTNCRHPCVVKIHGFSPGTETNPPTMVLSYVPHNLALEIANLTNTEKVLVAIEVMIGMRFIQEKKRVLHRKLKPENILLNKHKHVRIGDFARAVYSALDDSNVSDAMNFMAPELIDENKYIKKVDQYSFGKLLYFICTNGTIPPFNLREVVAGKKFPIPDSIPEFGRKMIEDCCLYDQDKRPSFSTLLETMKANNYALLPGVEVIDIKYRILHLERKEKTLA